ncbi:MULTISPECIES: LUD domain-containing protein [Nonlabens]|uniref:LUD domain-containing protein n=1 Tax=Nonlabens TaxID=363408 RepID=UPI000CF4132F|nr:LUD domain-containing protein [Nonlabens tegetincola]PQJ19308.1 lactate utilization protein B/C [Nonlabens tegetincola]
MGIFGKFFKKSTESDESKSTDNERSKYMPEKKLPLDEQFFHHFIQQGGRLLYSVSEEEIQANFEDILVEHDFFEKDVFCHDKQLQQRFPNFNLNFEGSNRSSSFFLTTCEYLISDKGALLFSSNQIKECKLPELPNTFVVLASTSQIVENIGEGLRGIKHRSKTYIPTNITTLKNFKDGDGKESKDIETYGAPNKRLYLLLLEDL